MIAAAQYGKHNAKRESYGHSLAFDPWGKLLVDAGGCESSDSSITTPSVVFCEIHRKEIDETRRRMPVQEHRKNAKYH